MIKKQIKLILSITRYVVADAYYSKKNFVEKILGCFLYLVSKLREDVDLSYLSIQSKTGKRGWSAKDGGKIDFKRLNPEYINQVVNDKGIPHTMPLYTQNLLKRISCWL